MSIDEIEKLHCAAVRAVAALHRGITAHTGVRLHRTSVTHDGATFCDPVGALDNCDNLSKSIAEMVAEIARHDPDHVARLRLAEIDKERAALLAKLEGDK